MRVGREWETLGKERERGQWGRQWGRQWGTGETQGRREAAAASGAAAAWLQGGRGRTSMRCLGLQMRAGSGGRITYRYNLPVYATQKACSDGRMPVPHGDAGDDSDGIKAPPALMQGGVKAGYAGGGSARKGSRREPLGAEGSCRGCRNQDWSKHWSKQLPCWPSGARALRAGRKAGSSIVAPCSGQRG